MTVINKVEFGVNSLHLATSNNDGTFVKPEAVAGVVSISLTGNQNKTTKYADDVIFFEISSNQGYEGELEIYNFDDEFKVKYFGFKKDKNGVLLEPSILKPVPVAMLFKVSGDKANRCSCLYNVIFEKPDISLKTIEEEVEVEALKAKFKATPIKIGTESYVQSSTNDATKTATWFETVYIPQFI